MIPGWVSLSLSLVLGALFAWAGVTKVMGPERWRKDLLAYRLGRPLRAAGLLVVPWLELGISASVLAGYPRLAGGAALVLLVVFSAAIVRARLLAGTNQLACGCFGGHTTRDYRLLLARNGALALLAGLVVTLPVSQAVVPGASPGAPMVLVVAGSFVVIAGGWILWQLRVRLRDRQERGPAGAT